MSVSIIRSLVSLPQSPFPPLAVGFMGLGTGYLIYGTQELFGYPARDDRVDFATGMWGIWMPGFMQFIAGAYLFLGLTLFGTFRTPALYMAALAFTSYGVHWFAIGWNRLRGTDPRVNVGMTIGIMPITGVTLPLMSYGGSSVITTLLAVGLLQSIYVQARASASLKGRVLRY